MFSMMRAGVVVAVSTLLLIAVPAVSQGFLYDDFAAKKINPDKWSGSEGSLGALAPSTETRRNIVDGELGLSLTSYGRTDSNAGTAGNASTRLGVTDPSVVIAMQADVTVKSVKITGCAANATSTASRAQVVGGFFNDGTSPAPGDRIGDIIAGIQKNRDSISGDSISAFIVRCTNATCSTLMTLSSVTFAAGWVKGVADTLRVAWEPAFNQFRFTVNPGPGEEVHVLGYGVTPDSDPPELDFKQLSTLSRVASCTAGRRMASMSARFDNVMVNP